MNKALIALTLVLAGCSHFSLNTIPCPDRPVLEAYSSEELRAMSVESMEKIVTNQIRMKEYAKKLEVRARCESR